jgi:D-tyrosyl-tRNA(Tyr) deacylase
VRLIIQRVAEAHVSVAGETVGKIGGGLCVFVGIGKTDNESNAAALADKVRSLRIFEDDQGKMNRSVIDVQGEILVVSQFTLYGDCTRGNRPSFTDAAPPVEAEKLYSYFVQRLRNSGLTVATGQFQAQMNVSLVNDGPVTFSLEA